MKATFFTLTAMLVGTIVASPLNKRASGAVTAQPKTCPIGTTVSGNNCICPWDNSVMPASKVCPCPTTRTWNKSKGVCAPSSCPPYSALSADGYSCVCSGSGAGGVHWSGSSCECNDELNTWVTMDSKRQNCICKSPATFVNGHCRLPCPLGTTDMDSYCRCPDGSAVDLTTMTCKCPTSRTWNKSKGVCAPSSCPPYSSLSADGYSCVCSGTNAHWSGSSCMCNDELNSWVTMDANGQNCICKTGAHMVNGHCEMICPTGATTGGGPNCVCTATQKIVPQNGTC